MFRKSSSSAVHLLSDGSCNSLGNEAQVEADNRETPLSSLVYYAAIAKGRAIFSEFAGEGNSNLTTIAAACLENVPPLHSRFNYTTNQRKFLCLLDGQITYCAIVDEALNNADSYSFLEKVRNAFKSFGNARRSSLTLGAHFMDEQMMIVMRNLAATYVGVPEKEKEQLEAKVQPESETDVDLGVASPPETASTCDSNDRDPSTKAEGKHLVSQFLRLPFITKTKKSKKKSDDQANGVLEDKEEKVKGKCISLEVMVDAGLWLGVCRGISCLKD
ncbi:hypothetical protein KP509_28G055000 [Ceratopteris richardii]|uniref:Longin domain-containing protein n=1 Tax=Ceratopteris richardii TaxID=49495 RepID=A0A8T2RC95_CERRI|nr:hypothetical protein KP509_28G055000 [Ceratopteris richardii]